MHRTRQNKNKQTQRNTENYKDELHVSHQNKMGEKPVAGENKSPANVLLVIEEGNNLRKMMLVTTIFSQVGNVHTDNVA